MKFNELAWIDLREYPGGPLMFLLQEQAHPIQIRGNAFSIIIGFLTDALLVNHSLLSWIMGVYLISSSPDLSSPCGLPEVVRRRNSYPHMARHVGYVASFWRVYPSVSICNLLAVLGALFVVQAAQPNSSLWAHTTLNFSVPYFSIAMGLNILLTGMLVTRLFYMRYKIANALGSRHGETYTNIAAMILESAAPYGIISLIFLVLYTIKNTAALLFIPLLVQVQVGIFLQKL
jgi:hypothetical protein